MTTTEHPSLLRSLTALQHALFATLLAVSVVRAGQHDANHLPLALATLLLVGWYAAGARRAGRHTHVGAAIVAGPHAAGWLLGLAVLWLLLVVLSPEMIWIGFALWLLAAHLLPLGWAGIFSAAVLLVVVFAPVLDGRPWTVAGVLGPTVGALFAVALARGQVLLARESIERARLVDSLVSAQAESAALHEDLLAAQREAGALGERARLSRDIHDTLAQGFSSIVLLARAAPSTGEAEGLRRLLRRIEETAAGNLAEARGVIGELAPKSLSDNGLTAALRRLVDDLAADTGIDAVLRVEDGMPALPTATEVALLRFAQGGLANVRRHAQARRVVLTLSAGAGQVRLDIVDDGVGFDPGRIGRLPAELTRGGYGLVSARDRLAELGGGLEIESGPGDGTALAAYLPIAAIEQAAR